MEKKIQPKTIGEAYKGTISTFIVTVFIISVGFFLPMITANQMQNAREGKGYFTPEESLIWDLKDDSGFEPVQYSHSQDELGVNHRTSTTMSVPDKDVDHSVFWKYHSHTGTAYINVIDGITEKVTFVEGEENAVDEFMQYTFVADGRKTDNSIYPHNLGDNILHNNEGMRMYLAIDSDTFVENDATKIVIWSDFETTGLDDYPNSPPKLRVEYRNGENTYVIQDWTEKIVGEKMEIELDIADLLSITGLKSTKGYIFVWERLTLKHDDFFDGTPYFFDIQVYGLMGKPNAITILSIWYIAQSILIFMLGLAMLPQVSFGGLSRLLRLNKEW